MCLGVPGKITQIDANSALGYSHGQGQFRRHRKDVCLAYVPEAQVGDYVIVHAGFALN